MDLVLAPEREEKTVLAEVKAPTLADIFTLQKFMLALPQYDFNQHLKHTFHERQYLRELMIPKGIIIIGMVHKHAHPNVVSKGHCIVYTTEGPREIDAREHPVTFISQPGTKRVVLALEDTYWTTCHETYARTEAEIIEDLIVPETNFDDLIASLPDFKYDIESGRIQLEYKERLE